MLKNIYHGSEKILEKPQFGFGKTYNDYGLGFYCTEVLDMAKEWGVSQDSDGYANKYQIDNFLHYATYYKLLHQELHILDILDL